MLEKSLSFDENNTDAIYFLGRCYQQKSDVEKAKSYYNKIVDNYPDSKLCQRSEETFAGTWRINYQLDKMIGFPVRVYEGKNTLAGIFFFIGNLSPYKENAPRGCDHRTEEDCIRNCAVTRKVGKPTLFRLKIRKEGD